MNRADWIFSSTLGICHLMVVTLYYQHVPDAYMDEIFHIDQARAYCDGRYDYWNDKITTPFLMYILTAFTGFCGMERYFNSLLMFFAFASLLKLRRSVCCGRGVSDHLTVTSVCLLPVLFQTSCLYYTDLLSLTLVSAGLGTKSVELSAFWFGLSILSRQTNIVWAAFHVFCRLLTAYQAGRVTNLSSLLLFCLRHLSFVGLATGFVLFMIANKGSVVLGDKTAHEMHLHLPQLLYFLLFSVVSSSTCSLYLVKGALLKARRWVLFIPFIFVLMFVSIAYFSYTHPYLLADNRHYTFYLWRRWMLRHSLCKYLLIPPYILSLFVMLSGMVCQNVLLWMALFGSAALTVVPAHLVEFRYFIVPFALWRLNVRNVPVIYVLMEVIIHVMVNIINAYMFIVATFKWENEPNNTQRFMW